MPAAWFNDRPARRGAGAKHAHGVRWKVKIDRVKGKAMYDVSSVCWTRFDGSAKEGQLLKVEMLAI